MSEWENTLLEHKELLDDELIDQEDYQQAKEEVLNAICGLDDKRSKLLAGKSLLQKNLITKDDFGRIKSSALGLKSASPSTTAPPPSMGMAGATMVGSTPAPNPLAGATMIQPSTVPPSASNPLAGATVIEQASPTPAPAPAGADQTNQAIGDYRVVKLLGQGGMGAVYMGRHKNPDFDAQVRWPSS